MMTCSAVMRDIFTEIATSFLGQLRALSQITLQERKFAQLDNLEGVLLVTLSFNPWQMATCGPSAALSLPML